MVDSEHSTDDFRSPKICIAAITKTPDMLKFVPDHLKTKIMCKHGIEKLAFVIRYVPDCFKNQ